MNADPSFRLSIVEIADKETATKLHNADVAVDRLHEDAYARIQTNERHVIMAYAAMWIAAVLFVVFLWRRQQGLVRAIDELQRELDAALKGDGDGGGTA